MAIINSLAIGKARKSAGNLTFSTVKGRTIAREKPAYVSNPQTVKQTAQRAKMATIVAAWRQYGYKCRHLFTVIAGFGSPYNEFVKKNIQLAANLPKDATSGVPYSCAGMQLGSGKYGSNALNIQADENNECLVRIMDAQLQQEIQVGDVVGVIATSDNASFFYVDTTEVTSDNIQALANGQSVSVDQSYDTGALFAPFWYSSSRNLSSTPILYKKA